MAPFIPRTVRGTQREAEWVTLRPGIPDGLGQPVIHWLQLFFFSYDHMQGRSVPQMASLNRVAVDLQIDLIGDNYDAWSKLVKKMDRDNERFIDVIDWCLHSCTDLVDVFGLEDLLARGGSVWKVGRVGDHYELQDRIDPTVEQAARTSATPGTSAAHHLADAWSHVYSQQRNPNAAYADSVMAVEFVVLPIVIPLDKAGTLGKAIYAMKNASVKWRSTLGDDGLQAAIAMMEALWRQHKRHGTTDATNPIVTSQEEAEAAVHLAATLVHWFDSGVVARA